MPTHGKTLSVSNDGNDGDDYDNDHGKAGREETHSS